MSWCWSTGNSSSLPLYCLYLAQNQWGNPLLIALMLSPFLRRAKAAPVQPDSLLMISAKRSSSAPHQSEVLPPHMRYMIKMFLCDLYNVWRPLEELVVAPTYEERKLQGPNGTSQPVV